MGKHLTEAPFTNRADLHTDWVFERLEDIIKAVQLPNKAETAILYDDVNEHYYEISVIMETNRIEVRNISNDHYVDRQIISDIWDCLCTDLFDDLTCILHTHVSGFEMLFFYTDEED